MVNASYNPAALLARLEALNPKQARTYCAESGTVKAWRRVVSRRKDGTIRGFYANGGGNQWESYEIPLVDAVDRLEKKQRADLKRWKESLKVYPRRFASIKAEIAECRAVIAAVEGHFQLKPVVVESVVTAQRAKIATLQDDHARNVAEKKKIQGWIDAAESAGAK